MKKTAVILAFLFLNIFLVQFAMAKDAIYKTSNGTRLKCTYKMTSGSIQEFSKGTDYFDVRNGKIYSNNLRKIFPMHGVKKRNPDYSVLRLKITDQKIRFYEPFGTDTGVVERTCKIDRKTGAYSFKARRFYHWGYFFKRATAEGKCTIVK